MAEVRTAPVKAQYQGAVEFATDPRKAAASWPPGGFGIEPADVEGGEPEGEQRLWWSCPCGCGHVTFLHVGKGFKPADGPSWEWNGSMDAPTLSPSVHRVGHWHGWLRNGVWESC